MPVYLPAKYKKQLPADIGNEETEEVLAEMIAEIESVYGQAYTELKAKADDYLAWFVAEDAAQLERLKNGQITVKEYQNWRQRKLLTGQHWYAMAETMADNLANSNGIACSIISDYLPEVYAINGNWMTYQIEHQLKINTSFELYDHQTVERLIRENPDLLPQPKVNIPLDKQWNKQNLQSAVMQSILQGESVEQLADRLAGVSDMNRTSAVRNAKTMTTSAQNGGRQAAMERAETLGIKGKKMWVSTLDHHTRASHIDLDEEVVGIHERFSNGLMYPGEAGGDPAEVYNCFIGDTKIASDCKIIRSYKHKYEGDVISIKTAGGVQFTCTPNHPILTLRGWIAAKLIDDGDDIVVASGRNREISWRNPHINHAFPRIDAIHKFIHEFGGKRTCTLSVNFHGDVTTSNVEIITQKRFLWDVRYTSACDRIYKFLLKCSDKSFMCKSPLVEHFRRVRPSTFSNVCGKSKRFSLIGWSLRHTQKHGLRPIALLDSGIVKPFNDGASGYAVLLSKCLHGFTGVVFSDKVVNVQTNFVSTHVYNLQTENGYYFVNSIIPQNSQKVNGIFAIAHNCRCREVEVFYDQDIHNAERFSRLDNHLGEMTYDEWKESHGEGKQFRAARSVNRDYSMMREYRQLLGRKVPTNIKEFQKVKYNDPEKWKQWISEARKARAERRRQNVR